MIYVPLCCNLKVVILLCVWSSRGRGDIYNTYKATHLRINVLKLLRWIGWEWGGCEFSFKSLVLVYNCGQSFLYYICFIILIPTTKCSSVREGIWCFFPHHQIQHRVLNGKTKTKCSVVYAVIDILLHFFPCNHFDCMLWSNCKTY